MVAAAAPSSAPARRGLPAIPRQAGPERRPRGRMGSAGVAGALRAPGGGLWAGEGGRQAGAARHGLGARRPGSRGSLCLGRLTASPGSPSGEGAVGAAGLGRAVLLGPRGWEALGSGRERPDGTGLTGAHGRSRVGPPRPLPRPRGLEPLRGRSLPLWMLGTSALGIWLPESAGAPPRGRS